MPPPTLYKFDGIVLDASAMRLTRGEQELALEPKSFRLLQFLIENRHRVVGKEEIFRVIWPETAVSDNALTRAIAQIRKALDDDHKEPRYIDTVPTVGYRFIAPLDEEAAAQAPKPTSALPKKQHILILSAVVCVLLIAAGFAAWKLWPRPAPPPMSPPVPLTTYRGNQSHPSFSPDGNQVAFDWDGEKQDNIDIYVKGLGPDAVPLRLTTNPAPDYEPAWSPDGATIAFIRQVGPNFLDLMLIPALGGPERKLAEFHDFPNSYGHKAAWSPDSKWLILAAGTGEVTSLFRVSAETGEFIQITHPEGGLEDSWAMISPDGASLIFKRHWHNAGSGDLYKVRLDRDAKPLESPRLLYSGSKTEWLNYPVQTPDGKELLIATATSVIRLRADGSESPTVIPWIVGRARGLALSPRGNRLAYAVTKGDANIYRIDLNAKAPQPELLIASTARDVFPQYSPEGSRLTFYSDRSGAIQIYTSDAEGKQARQITFVKRGVAASPHWSPDGRTLAFDSTLTGTYQVYTIDSGGGAMKQLTQGPSNNFSVSWSPDGRWLYFTSNRTGRNEIWKMPDGGGPATQVTHNGGAGAVVSPDGKTLYLGKEVGEESIWKMPLAGGQEEKLVDSVYRINFCVTARGIYYMTYPGDDDKSALKFYNFATGKSTLILNIGIPEYGLDVSPDGRYLAYAQLDDPGSVLMLVENFR